MPLLTPILFTLLLFSSCQQKAQSHKEDSKAHSIGQEVSAWDNNIWVIHQDKSGDYWFGSNGKGLYRYDGERITHFSTEDGLAGDQIRGIQEDAQGQLFIETSAGISVFDGASFRTLEMPKQSSPTWRSNPSDLWLRDFGRNGPLRYDGVLLYHHPFPEQDLEAAFGIRIDPNGPSRPYSVYSITKDAQGTVWFGTESAGVFRYDGDSLLWIGEKELSVLEDGRVPAVRSIVQDKEGHYWLSNVIHRYVIHEAPSPSSSAPDKGYTQLAGIAYEAFLGEDAFPYFMSAVRDDEAGDLWMLTYSQGMWHYDGETLTAYPIMDGERPLNLLRLYKDRSGTLWLGTEDAGVYRLEGDEFRPFRP